MRFKVLTAVVVLAGVAGLENKALADPYVDDVVSLERVTEGWTSGGAALTVKNDDTNVDTGVDVIGRPDFVSNDFRTMTALGFDEVSGEGGVVELVFSDNLCLDGFGNDLLIADGGDNEGGRIEVSDDSGLTYVPLGVAGPSNNFKVDAAGQVDFFNRVRITASDFAGARHAAGVDLDSVSCLNSLPQDRFASVSDECEFSRGNEGLDVMNAVAYSEYGGIRVTLDMCDIVELTGSRHHRRWNDDDRDDDDDDGDDNHRRWNDDDRGKDRWWWKRWSDKSKRYSKAIFRVNLDYKDQSNNDGDGVDDGADTLDANTRCYNTIDHVAKYEYRRESGGTFTFDGDRVTVDISYADLGVAPGDEVLLWIETQEWKGYGDSVPTKELGDKCNMPQSDGEVMRIVLR